MCCGCSACVNVCPQKCISMISDEEGFLYPRIDVSSCIDCGLCEKTCPFMAQLEPHLPNVAYAAINADNKEREQSSSGGVFSMLARQVLLEEGIVFGAAFDDEWNVCHAAIKDIYDLPSIRGSKYVQSIIGDCYKLIEKYLHEGKKVLFSGTPCQVAGLKLYLRKDYKNLFTVDVVCHGVPSPRVWKDYISSIQKNSIINSITFRDKCTGWKNYSFSATFTNGYSIQEEHNSNLFIQGFLHNMYLRPSCHQCKVKGGRSGSDITLGDYWGVHNIHNELNDNKGVSLVLVHTAKGNAMIQKVCPILKKTSYDQAIKWNACVEMSTPQDKWRTIFWNHYNEGKDIENSINYVLNCQRPTLFCKVLRKIKSYLFLK